MWGIAAMVIVVIAVSEAGSISTVTVAALGPER
jgi:hypothetical protein